ncbi:MAG: 2-oxoacid:acceptor oxidoreductase family protein, partial [Spirochaetales bacterium]|nr:2-oxoacid:acceptor oxidoreductase family protein [Spirochaetales bacterium]
EPERSDIDVLAVNANEIAGELGNAKVANMVMLGAYLAKSGLFDLVSVGKALRKVFGPKKAAMLPLNEAALERGAAAVAEPVR